MGFPLRLKVQRVLIFLVQSSNQLFLSTNSPWDIESFFRKSELGCCDKVCYHQKPFAVNVTHYTLRVKKLHVIFILTVGYY